MLFGGVGKKGLHGEKLIRVVDVLLRVVRAACGQGRTNFLKKRWSERTVLNAKQDCV